MADLMLLMDEVKATFDAWAKDNRDIKMEKEHGKSVSKFLRTIRFDSPFTFLDVGCGNGWLVRKIALEPYCKRSVGIDKSDVMIHRANSVPASKTKFVCTDILSWTSKTKFDYIFSMESLYYVDMIDVSLAKIFQMLKPGGRFFCGTDFYAENKATQRWSNMIKIKMHLYSKLEWKQLFSKAGFDTKTRHIKDPQHSKKWRREFGTLFITGYKPE